MVLVSRWYVSCSRSRALAAPVWSSSVGKCLRCMVRLEMKAGAQDGGRGHYEADSLSYWIRATYCLQVAILHMVHCFVKLSVSTSTDRIKSSMEIPFVWDVGKTASDTDYK